MSNVLGLIQLCCEMLFLFVIVAIHPSLLFPSFSYLVPTLLKLFIMWTMSLWLCIRPSRLARFDVYVMTKRERRSPAFCVNFTHKRVNCRFLFMHISYLVICLQKAGSNVITSENNPRGTALTLFQKDHRPSSCLSLLGHTAAQAQRIVQLRERGWSPFTTVCVTPILVLRSSMYHLLDLLCDPMTIEPRPTACKARILSLSR